VELKLLEPVDMTEEEGITVLKSKGTHIKLEIDTAKKNIADVLKLIDSDHVLDITISNMPLENIITEIYKENRQSIPDSEVQADQVGKEVYQ
jgi:ABC-2 type transport system ATP-binding protein